MATFAVAVVVAGICAQGMAHFFADKLGFTVPMSRAIGGILELVALTCALRARRALRHTGTAGLDGVAVWVVAAASGTFSALDSGDPVTGAFRIFLALLAAWLFERGLAVERRYQRLTRTSDGAGRIRWRISIEQIVCRLGLAEPRERPTTQTTADTAAESAAESVAGAAAARWITRLAVATARLHTVHARRRSWMRGRRARTRQHTAMRDVLQHTNLAHDEGLQQRLLAETAALIHAARLADITHRAFWEPDTPDTTDAPASTAFPASNAQATTGPSTAAASTVLLFEKRRTDARSGPGGPFRTGTGRTHGPTADRTQGRTGHGADQTRLGRTSPAPLGVPHPAPPSPYGPSPLPRTGRPHPTAGTLLLPNRPVWPLDLVRPAAHTPHPARPPARTKRQAPSPAPAPTQARRPKAHWVTVLADEITAAAATGRVWEPVYDGPDGLMARTGYGRLWCEKTVHAARRLAAQPRTDAPPPTGDADT